MRIDGFFSTLCVVIRHGIDPHSHRIAPHQPGIARLQQFGRRSHIRHFGVEPQVVLSESRMTGGRERLRSRLAQNLYLGKPRLVRKFGIEKKPVASLLGEPLPNHPAT
jgi:hypothetical protein